MGCTLHVANKWVLKTVKEWKGVYGNAFGARLWFGYTSQVKCLSQTKQHIKAITHLIMANALSGLLKNGFHFSTCDGISKASLHCLKMMHCLRQYASSPASFWILLKKIFMLCFVCCLWIGKCMRVEQPCPLNSHVLLNSSQSGGPDRMIIDSSLWSVCLMQHQNTSTHCLAPLIIILSPSFSPLSLWADGISDPLWKSNFWMLRARVLNLHFSSVSNMELQCCLYNYTQIAAFFLC